MTNLTEKAPTSMPMETNTSVIGLTTKERVKASLRGPTVVDTRDNSRMARRTERARMTLPMEVNISVIGLTTKERVKASLSGPTVTGTRDNSRTTRRMERARNTTPMETHTSVTGSMTQGLVKASLPGPTAIDTRGNVHKCLIADLMTKYWSNHSRHNKRTTTGAIPEWQVEWKRYEILCRWKDIRR